MCWPIFVAPAIAICGVAICGCGGSSTGPGTTRVSGTVLFKGEPVAGANVTFYPAGNADPALASQAITDAEGSFQLSTHIAGGKYKSGIAPGHYAVAITKLNTAAVSDTLNPPINLLPRKYADPKTSKLSADVSADRENTFDFALNPE
jgi:hypothetical protein